MRRFDHRILVGFSALLAGCAAQPPPPDTPATTGTVRSAGSGGPDAPAAEPPTPSTLSPSPPHEPALVAPPPSLSEAETQALLDSVVAMHGGNQTSAWSVKPRPSWVTEAKWRPKPGDDAPLALFDTQVSFVGPRPQRYVRMLLRNRNEEEVRRHGLLKVDFLPPHRSVELHSLVIHRGEEILSQINPFNLRFAPERTETVREKVGMPRRRSTAQPALLMRSPDLQIGDLLEVEYTIIGIGDPRLEARSSTVLWIPGALEPVDLLRYRVLADPKEPPLAVHSTAVASAPKLLRRRGQQEYSWEFRNVEAGSDEVLPAGMIQLGNFGDWETVARLNRPFFALGEPLPEIRELAAGFARQHDDKAAQARAALDYVQHRIAFDGTHLDRWTSEPRPLPEILRRRAADCKGKSLLLMAILRELGIDSEPVLVSPDPLDLRAHLPSPLPLTHMIVALRVDDREVFVDPIRQGDRGDLWSMPRLPFLTGLSLAPARGVVDIPHPCDDAEPQMVTSIRFRLGVPEQPTHVEFDRRIRRTTAADMKQTIDKEFAGLSTDVLAQHLTGRIGTPHLLGELVHRDDAVRDLSTIEADSIVIPNVWVPGEDGTMVADLGPSYMDRSLSMFVSDPAQLSNPKWFDFQRVETIIDLPEGATSTGAPFELALPGFRVRHEVTVEDHRVVAYSEIQACGLRLRDPRLILATLAGLPRRMALPIRRAP